MKRVVWMTDIHLNFVKPGNLVDFYRHVRDAAADVALVSGDIAEATSITGFLEELAREFDIPLYFVLGNHDFYDGGISEVRNAVIELCRDHLPLCYLTQSEPIALTESVGLVGHDGWADARLGDYERSMVIMNDYRLIRELAGRNKMDRWHALQDLGDAAAAQTRQMLANACARFPYIYLVTHVPPFREACWYDGQISDDEWMPHFTCKVMGEAILDVMRDHPQCHLTVLCGHTHGSGEAQIANNIRVLTGGAEYGFPAISRLFTLH